MATENPTDIQIAQTVHNYITARDQMKVYRSNMVNLAIRLGQDPRDAMSGSGALDYLDGLLAGRGHLPAWRKRTEEAEAEYRGVVV